MALMASASALGCSGTSQGPGSIRQANPACIKTSA